MPCNIFRYNIQSPEIYEHEKARRESFVGKFVAELKGKGLEPPDSDIKRLQDAIAVKMNCTNPDPTITSFAEKQAAIAANMQFTCAVSSDTTYDNIIEQFKQREKIVREDAATEWKNFIIFLYDVYFKTLIIYKIQNENISSLIAPGGGDRPEVANFGILEPNKCCPPIFNQTSYTEMLQQYYNNQTRQRVCSIKEDELKKNMDLVFNPEKSPLGDTRQSFITTFTQAASDPQSNQLGLINILIQSIYENYKQDKQSEIEKIIIKKKKLLYVYALYNYYQQPTTSTDFDELMNSLTFLTKSTNKEVLFKTYLNASPADKDAIADKIYNDIESGDAPDYSNIEKVLTIEKDKELFINDVKVIQTIFDNCKKRLGYISSAGDAGDGVDPSTGEHDIGDSDIAAQLAGLGIALPTGDGPEDELKEVTAEECAAAEAAEGEEGEEGTGEEGTGEEGTGEEGDIYKTTCENNRKHPIQYGINSIILKLFLQKFPKESVPDATNEAIWAKAQEAIDASATTQVGWEAATYRTNPIFKCMLYIMFSQPAATLVVRPPEAARAAVAARAGLSAQAVHTTQDGTAVRRAPAASAAAPNPDLADALIPPKDSV